MAPQLEFSLNGRPVQAEGVSPNLTLLEFLRSRGLTGTKEGCAEGDCGACSVVMVERDSEGRAAYRAVNSCLTPICLVAGRELISVEGIGTGNQRHPVQAGLVECRGSQCGFCTPGFVCSLFEAYYRNDLRTSADLDEQLAGNLCRCTGYRTICDAAERAFAGRAADTGADDFSERLKRPAPCLASTHYYYEGETFLRPVSMAELFEVLEANPEARLIAGATELGLDITKRFRKFPTLISLEAIPELKEIRCADSQWRIGAAATLTEIESTAARDFPALRDMLRVFGSRQIRNRATMGGNLVTASPIGDSAPVLLSLDAEVVLASREGERTLPISEFFESYRKTALRPGEILRTIIVPCGTSAPGLRRLSTWFKVSRRREMDISTVCACFTVDLDEQNLVRHARLAYGGVASTPVRARKTESVLLNKTWTARTIQAAVPLLREEFAPISDVRGSADYRSGLIENLLQKFFDESEAAGKDSANASVFTPHSPRLTCPPHESAHKHVTGEALYADDVAARRPMLEVWPVCAPHTRARILRCDPSVARQMPGVAAVLTAEDVPGENDVGAVRHDEVLLASNDVSYHGQLVALVVGETQEACRAAAEKVQVEYEPLQPVLTIEDAIAQGSFHTEPNFIRRGDVRDALQSAPQTLEGEFSVAGQEHFYLEMQAAWAEAGEDGSMFVMSSTQHPSEVQQVIARVLGVGTNKVVVESPRMGGGFGGKETQAAPFAALAALAAAKTNRPVRVRLPRDHDMILTGKRHPLLARFQVGFNSNGDLLAARIALFLNGGWSLDLSLAVGDRALFHLDNAYFVPHVEFSARVVKTNLASNTAFRGFGGPQGMLVVEEILDCIARRVGLPPEQVRERNLYRGRGESNTTHYGQEIEDNRIQRVWHELKAESAFEARRREIARWNSAHPHRKRGLAITPVKFGISFTVTHLNQAGALVLIYQDGTVQVNQGGTEMGQGVYTNIAMIAARELGLPLDKIRVMPTCTDKVPNTSATAASCGTDLNGMAVKNACEVLRQRLACVAAGLWTERLGRAISAEEVRFEKNFVVLQQDRGAGIESEARLAFAEVVQAAHRQRVSLSSTGYYRTPEIHYDREQGRGRPFLYYSVGAAVTEVEVDGYTGMSHILRTDILQDTGDSINEGINLGQIEGGFVQGAGWLTCEQLIWDDQGRLLTHSPDTYKIPAVGDRPRQFHVRLLANATQHQTIHGSKAVGEPPLMLAISVREAIRDAVAAFGPPGGQVPLDTPATCEVIFMAIRRRLNAVATDVLPQKCQAPTTPGVVAAKGILAPQRS
jgi:xanthine dehydrogenase molybdopterin binding subunit/xanthine dehydrogenase small subunit